MNKTLTVRIRITPKLACSMKTAAKAKGLSVSSYVCHLVQQDIGSALRERVAQLEYDVAVLKGEPTP